MTKAPDIERLIAFAYSGLEPSAAAEDAVREGLSAERARPANPARGRALVVLAIALVAVLVTAEARLRHGPASPSRLRGDGDTAPHLPVVTRPPTGVVAAGEEWIRVRLSGDGRILVPSAAAEAAAPAGGDRTTWSRVSLAGLAKYLDGASEAFDRREAAAGRSGFETLAGGVKVSRLRVVLLADQGAPWRHVAWVMTVCAERRMPRIAFAVTSPEDQADDAFHLDATLPTDLGLGKEERVVTVRVSVRSGDPVRYVLGNEQSEELASVARYLAAAKKAAESAGAPLRGEIEASARTGFREVAKLLAEFRQAGYDRVQFRGTAAPPEDVRGAEELPATGGD